MDPYERLAAAIILQAVSDYRGASRILMKYPKNLQAARTIAEVEWFFCSHWFSVLTALDGDLLIERLKNESNK